MRLRHIDKKTGTVLSSVELDVKLTYDEQELSKIDKIILWPSSIDVHWRDSSVVRDEVSQFSDPNNG